MTRKVTVSTFAKRRASGEKIVMVTAYDAPGAAAAFDSGIDSLLVGDSVAMAVLGYDNTLPVTMEDMLHHTRAVRRGAPEAFAVFDMPFMSYQTDRAEAMRNAGRAMKEAGADAVKLEGGAEQADLISALTHSGIPVMAHLGLLPQHVQALGGYRVAGRGEAEADRLLKEAHQIEEAGAFAVVLECVPEELATRITQELTIPTIGIGAGAGCSGQIQVMHDLLGISSYTPKHARHFGELGIAMRQALSSYAQEVKCGTFPGEANSFR